MLSRAIIIFQVLSFLIISFLHAHIIHVPGDSTTIQGGIYGAVDGDTVLVAPGTYVENLYIPDKAITVMSEEGPFVTIIDGNRSGSVVYFHFNEGSRIDGFTLTNGYASYGGGIHCIRSSPIIINNIITNNIAGIANNGSGGGIHCGEYSSPSISNNLITGNSATWYGGGINCYDNSNAAISGNTITGNSADYRGGGISSRYSESPINNCIVWDNLPDEIYDQIEEYEAVVTYSDVMGGYEGVGNIDSDPLFFDSGIGDYHLQQDPPQPGISNPCVDTGNPDSPLVLGSTRTDGIQDLDIIDMGFHYPREDSSNLAPYAHFYWTPIAPDPYDRITFDASESYDLDGEIVLYEWDWDDDGIYDESITEPIVTHSWSIRDIYSVTLRVRDDDSAFGVRKDEVHLKGIVIHVPDDYPTIQEGINAAIERDTVMVAPGTYYEHDIDFLGKRITVMGSDPEDSAVVAATIVDANSLGTVFHFRSWEWRTSVLTGLTITGGYANEGGGIRCYQSSPTIANNHIIDNQANEGAGIFCLYAWNVIIKNNIISENMIRYNGRSGSGITLGGNSNALVTNNRIMHNSTYNFYGSGGGIKVIGCRPTITHNLIAHNHAASKGGGIYIETLNQGPDITFSNNTVIGNSAERGSGLCWDSDCPPDYMGISNSIFWGNRDDQIAITNLAFFYCYSRLYVEYCDIQDGESGVDDRVGTLIWGPGNISDDPFFRDYENRNYHLTSKACGDFIDSPCIDAGNPAINDSLLACSWGLGTERSDMGAYGGVIEAVSIEDHIPNPAIPRVLSLFQNYPNPFNPSTTITFEIPGDINSEHPVSLHIYDIRGRCLKTLVNSNLSPGSYSINWNGINKNGEKVSTGIYLYRLKSQGGVITRKMTLVK